MTLTDKQRRFCQEFLIDFNATDAYLRAGYKGCRASARASSARLLANVSIQSYLSELREQASDRTEVTLDRTLQEIARVAFSDITDVLNFDSTKVTFKDSGELPADVTAAIESVSHTFSDKGERRAVKMHNKLAALGLLAKFFGIDSDFNSARATLKRYGLALLEDPGSELGWKLDRHVQ